MKRLAISFVSLLMPLLSGAQMYVDFDMLSKNSNTHLRMVLQDSKTKEPISYATVYLIPQGDTTITNFALSDEKGRVDMDEIISGKYEVNAEMIGYKPYVKVHDLSGWNNDLGAIDMEEDPEYIDAATITALANPVTIKRDTIEYNAAAFRVGENAMLEDLLKKMPGMEVSDDGTVKVNGEAVDKITVGGKTFFFNDPAMAVKNLPAKVVDKIKVIDKDKNDAEFTGVSTKSDREKVMDVQLREEYQKGWFGNARLRGGSTLGKAPDNELLEDASALFNGNAMAAWYNETDQVTLLAKGENAANPGGSSAVFAVFDGDTDELAMKQGRVTNGQAGANYNTERIKGFEASSNVAYTYTKKDAREKSSRTSFQPDGSEIGTDGRYDGLGTDNKVSLALELKKNDNSKFLFELSPTISFTSRDRSTNNTSVTSGKGGEMNSSNSATLSHSNIMKTGTYFNAGVKDLGRKGRSVTAMGYYELKNTAGTSSENSETVFSSVIDRRYLDYDNDEKYLELGGNLTYAEPLSEKWTLQARIQADYENLNNTRLAFNGVDGSANDYYTSWTKNRDITFSERLYAQYKKDDDFSVLFGASVFEERNVTNSRATGIETTVGENEWLLNWAPYAQLNWRKDYTRLFLSYSGYSSTPSGKSIIPVLDISNPVFVSTGNIYLKPSFRQSLGFDVSGSEPKKAFFYQLGTGGSATSNATVYASWFDGDGVRYSIPVNARKPSTSVHAYGSIGVSFGKENRFSFAINPYVSIGSDVNYQAKGTLPGFDKDHFDYNDMMSRFWGNPSGDIFYSGRSGFSESRTTSIRWAAYPSITYRLERFNASFGTTVENNISRYSLNPDANMNTWNMALRGNILYETKNGFEFGTDASYTTYKGYTNGYGKPALIWNAKVSKTVKSLVFSLGCADILNQNRSLQRTSSAEYYQDTYTNVLGRYFLLGISFNFGKMNAKNNGKVQNAMYGMIFN
ncbi:MAG: outer membrane beta-barrel protein [Bacteroidales bacterium]|nr:outer membrane beta-barrel protein [Candidatus Cryptobacteroides choladohippi]